MTYPTCRSCAHSVYHHPDKLWCALREQVCKLTCSRYQYEPGSDEREFELRETA